MSEREGEESKVVPLFAPNAEPGGAPAPDPNDAFGADVREDPESVRRKIQELLSQAEPEPVASPVSEVTPASPAPVPSIERRKAPDPAHRNAMSCPQCDEATWRLNQFCIHCGFDLDAHFEAQIQRRRRRWVRAFRLVYLASWLVVGTCFFLSKHYPDVLPGQFRADLMPTGIVLAALNLFILWLATGKRGSD